MKISGIYKIICLPTGKFYIGSSSNLRKRLLRHKNELRKNIHPNRYLQSAWDKYTEISFDFIILEEVDPNLLIITEQKWLDNTKCYDRNIGFNLSSKAESTKGIKFSEESRNKKSKSWIVTSPEGEILAIKNLLEFCTNNNLESSLMCAVAHGKRPHHKNWTCRPANVSFDEWNKEILSLKKINGNNKTWIVTNPNNDEIVTNNLTEFCKLNGLNYINMAHTANGFQTNHKGWKCRKLI